MSLSPCRTWTSTFVWLSATVVNIAALAGRDRAVALDQRREGAVLGLDAQRVRRDVEQHQVLDLAGQDAGLDRRAHRDALVGVHRAVGLAAEHPAHDLGDLRRAGLAADEQDLVDLLRPQARVGQAAPAGLDRALEQVVGERLVLLPRAAPC